MLINSRKSKRLPANAWRWRIILLVLVLVLALMIGSAGQTHPAQAAPSAETVTWFMDVEHPKTLICVGETVEYKATAHYNFNGGESEWALPGVKIEADSRDSSIGTFKKGSQITGFANEDLVTASFFFTAKKPGKTILDFQALVDPKFTSTYISFMVPIKVINCKYKVNIISKWRAGMTSVATINGEIAADENGYFSGSATVNWTTSKLCGIVSPIAPSTADLKGTINESGKLVLQIIFGPISSTGGGNCGAGISTSNFGRPDPLTVTVPDSGGVFKKVQLVTATNSSFPGSAIILAIPKEK